MGYSVTAPAPLSSALPRRVPTRRVARPRRARRDPACSQEPLRGPIHKAISGYRYYIPPLGRWPSRDPIGDHAFLTTVSLHDLGVHVPLGRRSKELTQLYAFVLNNPILLYDILGLDPQGPGGVHPALVNPPFHLAQIAGNVTKILDHLQRFRPGFGCAMRMAKDSLNHARMYEEHTGDDSKVKEWKKQVRLIKSWERSYWWDQNIDKFCKPLEVVSWGILIVCVPQCLPAAEARAVFTLCPAF